VLGSVPIDAAGQATLTVSLGVDNHALSAVFGGSAGFAASTSAITAETVTPAATAIVLSPSASGGFVGQPITFVTTVSAVAPGSGAPTGTVTLLDGATVLGTASLGADGRATFVTSGFATAGSHPITAMYNGDANFAASAQSIVEQINAAPARATTTTLGASPKVVHRGQTVRFTADVRGAAGPGTPTGDVSFFAGNKVVARVRLNAAGRASFKRHFVANGRFVIRAVYSGDSQFAASSQSINEQVRAQRKAAGRT
jgi:hypothetical protein